ncbi:MAG: AraC family transcriptional regulator [Rikenellaceae bacterium]
MNNQTIPFKHANCLNGLAYYKACPILHANEKLRFRYHQYETRMSYEEQLRHTRTMATHVLIFQLEGETHLNWGRHKDVVIKPEEIYFLPRGAEVSGYIVGAVNFVVAIIERGMTHKELEDLRMMKTHEKFNKYEFKSMPMHPPMLRLAQSIKEYLVSGVNCSHLHEAKFNELYVILHWYYSLADNAQLFYPMAGAISEFKEFILNNFQHTKSIEELVAKANMSRSTFDRKFKEIFDATPRAWLEEQTRQTIISRASEPNVTVKDIMYEIGVYNPSQFTKLCKRLCGVTPSVLIRSK